MKEEIASPPHARELPALTGRVTFENVSFSTKENPEHATTKGSIIFENIQLIIDEIDGKIIGKVYGQNN